MSLSSGRPCKARRRGPALWCGDGTSGNRTGRPARPNRGPGLSPGCLVHRTEGSLENAEGWRPRQREDHDLGDVLRPHHVGELSHVGCPEAPPHAEICGNPARADVRAADPVLTKLVIERTGEANLREF